MQQYFAAAGKPAERWRVGTEHELIAVRADGSAPPYEGPGGIRALLDWFAGRGWEPVLEDGHPIALTRGDSQITIEPGGQFELAAPPFRSDLELVTQLREHSQDLARAGQELGLSWLSSGLRPFGRRDDIGWMPKQRYNVMRAYMPTVGTRGLDMMLRTATVQTNLDFADEPDAAAKMRVLQSVSSILTALWANSSIVEGQVTEFQSARAWIWRDTDSARSGLLPFVFTRDSLFADYTEWALDVPMYFVHRGGYLPVTGLTFRQFMQAGWNGHRATRSDWALHLSTLFPEVRLKKYLEVRGADCGSMAMNAALAPLTRAISYDATARDAAWALTAKATFAERVQLADEVPRSGLSATLRGTPLLSLARELVAIAQDGLARLEPAAVSLLDPVAEIAATGYTQADRAGAAWRKAVTTTDKIAALTQPF
ncbi:MAG TPA: glutamate-cysteine ligase family protein [Kofleriaceae bacterium]|nr:glutamate-cysteine ligase family protein [Kofleriaceae bacterium]